MERKEVMKTMKRNPNQRKWKWIKKRKNVSLVKVVGLDLNASITTPMKTESSGEEIQNSKEVTASQGKEC